MRSSSIQTNNTQQVDLGRSDRQHSYLLTMRLPDAQHFGPEYGISYAQSRLSNLGVKVDRSFKIEPSLDPKPDAQGARYVTYILRADMTSAQARAARDQGFGVERDRINHALSGT